MLGTAAGVVPVRSITWRIRPQTRSASSSGTTTTSMVHSHPRPKLLASPQGEGAVRGPSSSRTAARASFQQRRTWRRMPGVGCCPSARRPGGGSGLA